MNTTMKPENKTAANQQTNEPKQPRPVRPLEVLVSLLLEDIYRIEEGDYQEEHHHSRDSWFTTRIQVGEKLLEAKSHFKENPREFLPWAARNLGRRKQDIRTWIAYTTKAKPSPAESTKPRPVRPPLLNFASASSLPPLQPRKPMTAEVRKEKQKEIKLRHQLRTQLIDAGYKALAVKLHPDHGGSREAMAQLNWIRNELKGILSRAL